MLIDLHNHTWPRSHDSVLDPKDLAQRAKDAGLDAFCLTEHDALWPEDEAQQIADEIGITVIPGCEVSTDPGHILAWGMEKYVFGMHRVDRWPNMSTRAAARSSSRTPTAVRSPGRTTRKSGTWPSRRRSTVPRWST